MEKELTLKEKYVLLAWHPEKGKPPALSGYHSYGIAGAAMLELAELNKIKVEDKKVILSDTKKTGDEALDIIIERLARAGRNKRISTWISKFAQSGAYKKIKNIILDGLVEKRYLKKEEATALLFFKYDKYPARDTRLRKSMIDDIQKVVLKRQLGTRDTYLLIGLAGATRISGTFFERVERSKARKRIKEIMKSNDIAKALNGTVAAVQMALIGSIAASAAATAAATSK
ncbi:MAG: GOLPH3/VPS74 family protein [Bacteroidota bacterium]